MNTILRMAAPADAGRLTQLALLAKSHWGYTDEQIAAWRDDLTIDVESIQRHWTVVAESVGVPAGVLQLEITGGQAQLLHLWVDPRHMRRGIGRLLLQASCDHARSLGLAAIQIDSDPFALPFYRACGARTTGSIPAPIAGQPQRVRPQLVIDLD